VAAPMSGSPTTRSLALMRKRGYLAAVVEKWNPHVKRRQDLFGFVDIIAVGDHEVVVVQTTTADNLKSRVRKIEHPKLHKTVSAVRKGGIRILVHGWWKCRRRWQLREIDVS
jgi:hypothetical protein